MQAMASLNDSFLADLEELSDHEENDDVLKTDNAVADNMKSDFDSDIEALKYDDLDSVSKLHKTQRYNDTMQRVEKIAPEKKGSEISSRQGSLLEDDPEHKLILDCTVLSVDIENEIFNIHSFIRDKYRRKFPELESLIPHPIDYARVVKKIGNETDLTLVDLEGLLPSATIMVVSITASTTTGKPLPRDVLEKTLEACDRALALDSAKKKLLDYVESRIEHIAPNLSAVVGASVAAKLMGTKRKNLFDYMDQTEILQSTPPSLRRRASRLMAAKSMLAARVDAVGGDPLGNNGRKLREEVQKKIERWQEPPPARRPKPLPVPDSQPKKKRGGRRLRKMKERYAVTDTRRLVNRMRFGVPEESSLGDGLGEGYGMLLSVGPSRLSAKATERFKERSCGLASSLWFASVRGIELSNPQANELGSGTRSSYFSGTGTFPKIRRS